MNKLHLVLLVLISSCLSICQAQSALTQPAVIFHISSMENKLFSIVGKFSGEYRIYSEFIEINLNQTTIQLRDNTAYKGKRLLRSIKIGLANNLTSGEWKITSNSLSHKLNKILSPNETYEPDVLKFFIPKNPNTDLSKYWLVITLEGTTIEAKENPVEYYYTHSGNNIFNIPK